MKRRAVIYGGLASSFCSQSIASEKIPHALSGDSFLLKGQEYALADTIAPSLVGPNSPALHAEASTEILTKCLSRGIAQIEDVLPPDRWGRRLVSVQMKAAIDIGANSISLQKQLISSGGVRVNPRSERHETIREYLLAEREARLNGRGMWGYTPYHIQRASSFQISSGVFQIIEGFVKNTKERSPWSYLNFGENYKTDFTVSVRSRLIKKWRLAGVDLMSFSGSAIRVRGFVSRINGPMIELKHLLQIERL